MKLEFSRKIFEKQQYIKINEDPPCGRRIIVYGQAGRQAWPS